MRRLTPEQENKLRTMVAQEEAAFVRHGARGARYFDGIPRDDILAMLDEHDALMARLRAEETPAAQFARVADMPYSILQSSLWPQVAAYFKIEVYGRDGGHKHPRVRIEVGHLPSDLMHAALALQVRCVSCGAPVFPIRARAGKVQRVDHPTQHLYFAPCCPLDVRIGCSRGQAAKHEYVRLKAVLRPDLLTDKERQSLGTAPLITGP